jgi:nickel superoxide dismutase
MMRTATVAATVLILAFVGTGPARAHCEIPCGIYGDTTRIDLLYEHIRTVEKSMNQIVALSKDSSANANQLVRWVGNKETHAGEIQHIVTQYFMTQRVKPNPAGDDAARTKYVGQLTALHDVLIRAMKAKQTTDLAHVEAMRHAVEEFSRLYFSEEDFRHIREHHAGGHD